jgi:hypothetical protein
MYNRNGEKLMDFTVYNHLKIMSSWYEDKESHKFTWNTRAPRPVTDHGIANEKLSDNTEYLSFILSK